MIISAESLAALIAVHLHLGEARLCDLFPRAPHPALTPEAGEEEMLRLIGGIQLPRQTGAKARRLADRLLECGAGALTWLHPGYPSRLRRLLGAKAPAVLYVQGNRTLFEEPSVAVIGTRRPSADGRKAARSYAEALAQAGWMVTSGNAPGVDAAAHQAVLHAGGRTLVYPPTPLDSYEPSFDMPGTASESVLVASPFPPGSAVEPWCFLRRNELVAAQSGAALVAETGTRGGTLNTAGHVRRLKRDLFVTDLPDSAGHRRAHEMLATGGAHWMPVECTTLALEALLKAAQRPLPPEEPDLDFFSAEVKND